MYFKELAAIFGISPQTLRKKIRSCSDNNLSNLRFKRGTGTYFYTKEETDLIFQTFNILT